MDGWWESRRRAGSGPVASGLTGVGEPLVAEPDAPHLGQETAPARDVVVIGGGSTGFGVASRLRRDGYDVSIVERRQSIPARNCEFATWADVGVVDSTWLNRSTDSVIAGSLVESFPNRPAHVRAHAGPGLLVLSGIADSDLAPAVRSGRTAVPSEQLLAASWPRPLRGGLGVGLGDRSRRTRRERRMVDPIHCDFAHVDRIEQLDKGWRIHGLRPAGASWSIDCGIVILAAGSLGTTEILANSKARGLATSPMLGERMCANTDLFSWSWDELFSGTWLGRPGRRGSTALDEYGIPVAGPPAGVHFDEARFRATRNGTFSIDWATAPEVDEFTGQVISSGVSDLPDDWRELPVSLAPSGGACVAEDAVDGAVDVWGRVFSGDRGALTHRGLFVADAAFLPAPLRGHPREVVHAWARRVSVAVTSELMDSPLYKVSG